jgi:hypothetical protein
MGTLRSVLRVLAARLWAALGEPLDIIVRPEDPDGYDVYVDGAYVGHWTSLDDTHDAQQTHDTLGVEGPCEGAL